MVLIKYAILTGMYYTHTYVYICTLYIKIHTLIRSILMEDCKIF